MMRLEEAFAELIKNEFALPDDFLRSLPKIPHHYLLSKGENQLADYFK